MCHSNGKIFKKNDTVFLSSQGTKGLPYCHVTIVTIRTVIFTHLQRREKMNDRDYDK